MLPSTRKPDTKLMLFYFPRKRLKANETNHQKSFRSHFDKYCGFNSRINDGLCNRRPIIRNIDTQVTLKRTINVARRVRMVARSESVQPCDDAARHGASRLARETVHETQRPIRCIDYRVDRPIEHSSSPIH